MTPAAALDPAARALAAHRPGVLLVNTGTPDAPRPREVRRYLGEFLGDPAVVDLPAPARWLLLKLVILPFRPARSARAYARIWGEGGSPLLVHSLAQRDALAARLPEAAVALGMRYGQPSMTSALESLRRQGATHVTLLPLFPQWAGATSGTIAARFEALTGGEATDVTPPFYGDAGFIDAWAAHLRAHLEATGAETVLFSYHGLPLRQLDGACSSAGGECPTAAAHEARCYRAQCHATSRAIARAAGLGQPRTSFQSRMRGTSWMGPHTDEVVERLGRGGVRRLAVVCPGFVADCLETLEEIGLRAADAFREAGGEQLTLVPSLNDDPHFIDALAALLRRRWAASPGGLP